MFLVLGLPRSRTYWLSKFLSYRDYECGHEEARYLRSFDDAKIWLNRDFRGSSETAVAPFWRLIFKTNPNLKVVVVRRPVSEVVASTLALDMNGVGSFDAELLANEMIKLDRKLAQIERRVPNVLSVQFCDLNGARTARAVFEHCLPYPFDAGWWARLVNLNLQCNMRELVRYRLAYRDQLDRVIAIASRLSKAQMMVREPKSHDGVTFQQEEFDDWERDGASLFEQHCIEVGESPDNWKNKNIPLMRRLYKSGYLQITTARCNGKMFGYLAAILSPSLEAVDLIMGTHTTFYVSKEIPGLGLKLQRASVAALKAKGAGEIFFHEGIRGAGPRMGVIYERLGAQKFGRLYRLECDGV